MATESRIHPGYRWGLLGVVVVAFSALGWYFFLREDSEDVPVESPVAADAPPADPRLTFDTPFRNVKPEVQYVGDAKCAQCHSEIDKTYHGHPMGRSADFTLKASPIERYDAASHNPCTVGPYELRVEKVGNKVLHHVSAKDATGKPLPEYVMTADLEIGSGTRGRSYLALDRGAVWQTPISWYGPEHRWDLSPGFNLGNGGRRPIVSDCLYCHVDRVDPVPMSVNRYKSPFPLGQASIGCERCHGPGELHVAERSNDPPVNGIDYSIVNPKHLSSDLQVGICAQCHLQGEQKVDRRGRSIFEYRPGLPLEMFVTLFVRHPDAVDLRKSVGQFEQMRVSRCFTDSNGRLGCTSCHEPHSRPALATRDDFYNRKCQSCHGHDASECTERVEVRRVQSDHCIVCHMPRSGSSNIVHTSITDHRIPRRPNAETRSHGLMPGTIPIVPFPIGPHTPASDEAERDLGIGLSHIIFHVPANQPQVRAMVAALAEERLVRSVSTWRNDVPAWDALYKVRQLRGDLNGALDAATTASNLAPESEEARADLASAAAASGKFAEAIAAAGELIRLNPSSLDPLLLRAGIFLQMEKWKEGEKDCRSALAIHPLHPRARLLLAISMYRLGERAGARREADTAAHLTTNAQQKAAFEELFRTQTR